MNEKPRTAFLSFFVYFFVFILMVEWLKPVIELTDTSYLKLFCSFLAVSFLLYFLKFNWKIVIPLKILFISWALVSIYTDISFFSRDSIVYLWGTLEGDLKSLVSRNWMAVTDTFRTLLFFTLLWMTTYLLNYWIRVRNNLLLFFILTVLFITILDTFSPYDGERSIVIILISGFIVNGLLFFQRLIKGNKIQVTRGFLPFTLVTLFGLIAVSGAIAYALPKAGPSWPDPVPFLTSSSPSATGGKPIEGGNITRKVGYSENDEKLGGAFLKDDTPVFYATVPRKQYWKIETKDTYTSKGWIQSEIGPQIINYEVGTPIISDIKPGREDKKKTASIEMMQGFDFVMQPYGIKSLNTEEQATLSLNATNQKILTFRGGSEVSLASYDISYSEPIYSLKALRGMTDESLNGVTSDFDRYLQLPETLPSRVKDLALNITENEVNLYQKVKAIERYFSRNDFRYDQKLAAIPKENTDYVDQFLFDTKIGYCDNFSTSMVVMLRTLGIPSRWVKGFTAGEIVRRDDDVPVYEVTNNNAHSWVEAYLPDVGWMFFEPTIGFSNSANLDYDLDMGATDDNTPVPPVKQQPKKEQVGTSQVSEGFTKVLSDGVKWVVDRKVSIIWSCVGLFLLGLLAYNYRRKWIAKVLIPVYRMKRNDWGTFEKMYIQLLKQLSLYGFSKEQGQTLADYAKRIDAFFGNNHMRKLTSAYEKGFYGGNGNEVDFAAMRESWENLINQLSG